MPASIDLVADRTFGANALSMPLRGWKWPAGLSRWLVLSAGTALSAAVIALHGADQAGLFAVLAAVSVASFLSSIAGFAFSAICGAILFHLSGDPVEVVQIMMTCSIANQAAMTWDLRRDIDWNDLGVYLAGGLAGLPIGIWVLLHVARGRYILVMGVFLLAYGATMLVRKAVVIRRQHGALDFAVGMLGGITGGAAAFPSAPVAIWGGTKGWNKGRQRALCQPFILIMQVVALAAISLARSNGTAGMGFDYGNLLFIPSALLGTALGLALYRRLSDRQFGRIVNVLLIVAGLSYMI